MSKYAFLCVTDIVGSQWVLLVCQWSAEWSFQTPDSIQMASHFLVSGLLCWDISCLASHAAWYVIDSWLSQTAGFVALTVPCLLCLGISCLISHVALCMIDRCLFQTADFISTYSLFLMYGPMAYGSHFRIQIQTSLMPEVWGKPL